MATYLIVGLGNPGDEYANTRHNAGFMAVDLLGERLGASYWKDQGGALVAKVNHGEHTLVLAKPQSFMNLSGGPVKNLLGAYGLSADDLIVLHDELDIPSGAVKVKKGGGHGGHNGLRSICDKLGTKDWSRVRLGIGRPPGRMDVAAFVLSEPRKEAADELAHAVEVGADAALYLLDNGLEKTQQQFNG